VTILAERPPVAEEPPEPEHHPSGVLAFFTTTDHKRIGLAYMVTAFFFAFIGGALAMLIRTELYSPGMQVVDESRFNELFTMHGTIMVLFFVGPFGLGLANYIVPLQIGARDMAFPRLNALSYWFFVFGGLIGASGFLTSAGAADFGWTGYTPLSSIIRSPEVGGDLWLIAIVLTGLSSVLTAVNLVATVFSMRAPGMTMFRMPIFTWNMLIVSTLILMVFPVLTAAGLMLFADRHFGAHIYDVAAGGSDVLWQHLFWFFGHPEVYIVILPFFGVITEILPVFSWRPVFGYKALVFATLTIGGLSVGVWAHHMFTTGVVLLPFFSGLSLLIAVPTGIKFFNWIGTMWGGRIRLTAAMWWALGFLFTFLLGGLTGVMLAEPAIDFAVHDTYFVVAHFHYTMVGGSQFAIFASIYYWFPKFTGRRLSERIGKFHVALFFVGFQLTFLIQHVLGLRGMPRRVADYLPGDGFTFMNRVSSIGAFLQGLAMLVFLYNVWRSLRRGERAGDDPWGGHTLEWWTPSPPPAGNFVDPLPPIRSNRPVWDARQGVPVP
jgi:cytochrome c oxidase subunit 1